MYHVETYVDALFLLATLGSLAIHKAPKPELARIAAPIKVPRKRATKSKVE
jgi:hypothetical protein